MTDIYGLTYDRLCEELSRIGEKPSRAGVIYPAIYRELISDLSELRLNASSVSAIKENFTLGVPECVKLQNSEAADKYLFALSDGYTVESVLMKHEFGYNICVSTQVGCNMGCRFCMSGRLKRRRDLTAGEMTGQYIAIRRLSGHEINGISIMGTGEPMENLGNVLDFIRILTHGKGAAVGVKHITVSTCGISEGIRKLALSDTPVNLAESLHAPTDELRETIMPSAKRYRLAQIMDAARFYSESLNRRVTLEYVMLDGINDSDECAARLAELIGNMNAYVNIIRYNPTPDSGFLCSPEERIMSFYDVLKKHGIGVTLRRSLGASISAACGQLSAGTGEERTAFLEESGFLSP